MEQFGNFRNFALNSHFSSGAHKYFVMIKARFVSHKYHTLQAKSTLFAFSVRRSEMLFYFSIKVDVVTSFYARKGSPWMHSISDNHARSSDSTTCLYRRLRGRVASWKMVEILRDQRNNAWKKDDDRKNTIQSKWATRNYRNEFCESIYGRWGTRLTSADLFPFTCYEIALVAFACESDVTIASGDYVINVKPTPWGTHICCAPFYLNGVISFVYPFYESGTPKFDWKVPNYISMIFRFPRNNF